MIHVFSGRWPEPQVGPNQLKDGKLVPVTEAERREVFLQAIGCENPLMDLILRCINNDPRCRARASEIVEQVAETMLQCPTSFANQLEMMGHIEHQEDKKGERLNLRAPDNDQNQQEISRSREQVEGRNEEVMRMQGLVEYLEEL